MANNSGYSSSQILSMQKDAVRRVNEMQRQAQERLRQTQSAMNGGVPGSAASSGNAGQNPIQSAQAAVSEHGGGPAPSNSGQGGRPQNPGFRPQPHHVPEPAEARGHAHSSGGPGGGDGIQGHSHPTPITGNGGQASPKRHDGHQETAADHPAPIPAEPVTEIVTSPFAGILQRMGLDQETVMLLVMLLLMVNEGADTMLILALVYIML